MRLAITLAAAAAALAVTPAAAQGYSPWSFGASIGTDAYQSGDVVSAATSSSLTLSTLNQNLTGTGVLQLRGADYDDAYDRAINATVEVRYAATDMSEFFGAISYTKASGKQFDAGCVLVTGNTACNQAITGQLSDLSQIGVEVGYRQWFGFSMMGDRLKPYFAVRGGLVRTDAIDLSLSGGTIGGLADWTMYEETWTAMIGADLGATYAISPNAELGAEVGVRYTTALGDDDGDFGGIGLGTINDSSERLTVPVAVRLNAVF
jgi:hypothetical protein